MGVCLIGKCEIKFNIRVSVLGKIFERTDSEKLSSFGKNGLCVLGARGLNVKISFKWQNIFRTTLKNLALVGNVNLPIT